MAPITHILKFSTIFRPFFVFALVGCFMMPSFGQTSEGLQKVNGTSLYIKVMGKGEPLLIVHGGPGMNHFYFLPHLKKLAEKYKVIFYDQRASGLSAISSPDSLSLTWFADDIEAIRQAAGESQINILAHSWGAIPAVNYAMKYPNMVKSMILCSPVPLNKEYEAQIKQTQSLRVTSQDSTDQSIIRGSLDFKNKKPEAFRKLMLFSFRHSFYEIDNLTKLHIFIPPNYLQASQALYAGLSKDLTDYNYYPYLRAFPFPVLVMHGEADVVPVEASKRIMESAKYSSMIIFNKSGHFVFIEEPKKFLKTVSSFLD